MPRMRSCVVGAVALVAVSCQDHSSPTANSPPISADFRDAMHRGGNPHFFLLPPLVEIMRSYLWSEELFQLNQKTTEPSSWTIFARSFLKPIAQVLTSHNGNVRTPPTPHPKITALTPFQ